VAGIDFFHPTSVYAAQTQRIAGEALYGAADVFEIEETCRGLKPDDVVAWDAAWMKLAEKAEGEAKAADGRGEKATAIARYYHASSYFRQSEMFFYGPDDKRKAERFLRAQSAFRRAIALKGAQFRVVQVKSGNDTYDGYFCLPDGYKAGTKVPTVFLIGGADSYGEENFFSGTAMLARGIAMLILDTPGRGSAIYLKNIPARPDYDVPVKAAIDWLATQPEVDPNRIGLAGISMGGYYAPRAAAFDKRVKALICWCGTINLLQDLYIWNPPIQRQLQWITGSPDDATARKKLNEFDLTKVIDKITMPTLVVHGTNDRVMDVRGAQRFFEALKARDKTLKLVDGAGSGHCSYAAWSTVVPFMFDWMATKLSV
jgi:dipeptidyl aminopeptidase/acylaminoacyl peptidase